MINLFLTPEDIRYLQSVLIKNTNYLMTNGELQEQDNKK